MIIQDKTTFFATVSMLVAACVGAVAALQHGAPVMAGAFIVGCIAILWIDARGAQSKSSPTERILGIPSVVLAMGVAIATECWLKDLHQDAIVYALMSAVVVGAMALPNLKGNKH